ncbi:MAG: hypothetical protein ACLPSF_11260 [Methylocella sp.]
MVEIKKSRRGGRIGVMINDLPFPDTGIANRARLSPVYVVSLVALAMISVSFVETGHAQVPTMNMPTQILPPPSHGPAMPTGGALQSEIQAKHEMPVPRKPIGNEALEQIKGRPINPGTAIPMPVPAK